MAAPYKLRCMIKNPSTRSSVGLYAPAKSLQDGYQQAVEFVGRVKHWTWFLGDEIVVEIKVEKDR